MKDYYIYIYRYSILLLATLSIIFTWENTVFITSLLVLLAVLINVKSTMKEKVFYVVVSILATLVESSSIATGAWVYSHQQVLNFPIWLPIYWGMGGIAMKDTYLIIQKVVK